MSKFIVREKQLDPAGNPVGDEKTWPPIEGADVALLGGIKVSDTKVHSGVTGADGRVEITDFKVLVTRDGFADYEGVYPDTMLVEPGDIPVSLRRL